MFVFLPDSMLPCERQDLKTLSILETKYFIMNTLISSSRLLQSFMSMNLLAVAAGGSFPVIRRVELMVWGSRDIDRQHSMVAHQFSAPFDGNECILQ